MSRNVILAIESAIGGGSLALMVNGRRVASWHGDDGPARSEELLLRISQMMEGSSISRDELSKIAVSNGPGSYTGIRIGIATAAGLAASLNRPCVGISLLNSIARNVPMKADLVAIVPVGRQNYCWQHFLRTGVNLTPGQVTSGSLEAFAAEVENLKVPQIVAHSAAYQALIATNLVAAQSAELIDVGRELAAVIAIDSHTIDEGLEPHYVHETKLSTQSGV